MTQYRIVKRLDFMGRSFITALEGHLYNTLEAAEEVKAALAKNAPLRGTNFYYDIKEQTC